MRNDVPNAVDIVPNLKIKTPVFAYAALPEILLVLPGTNTCHYSHPANQPHDENNNYDGSDDSVSKHSGFSFQSGPGYWPTTFSTCPTFFWILPATFSS